MYRLFIAVGMALLTIVATTVASTVLLAIASYIPSTTFDTYQPALVSELQRGEDTLMAYEQFSNGEYQ